MEDYYEYLDSNGVTTLYTLIKDDTVALIDGYSVTLNGITTNLDSHVNNTDIHTPIATIEGMIDTRISGLVNSAPETLDTLKELSDALGNDPNFATTIANQIGTKANKDSVYTKLETDTLLEGKANSVHNHVVSDITDMPTIPTKTSQLINDSGFLTSSSGVISSVSWSDIKDKPNFSTVATSGSYTDLSNTPTIPTKVSQLENDMGFGTGGGSGDTSNCVHKTGNETISGTKTFTNTPFVSGEGATIGICLKNTAIARNEVPSTSYYSVLRTVDKNNKILGDYVVMKTDKGATNAQINIRSEDSNGNQLINALNFSMANDNSSVSFAPSVNNKVNLGTLAYKWAKVYSDDVVHTSGNESITGSKTFSNQIYLGSGGSSYGLISAKDNNSILRLFGGTSPSTGANLDLYGEGLSSGGFSLRARTSDKIVGLDGSIDGTLKWNGKNVALDENLVHTSGREVIGGDKIFQKCIYRQADVTTDTVGQVYRFDDTNAKPCGSIYNRMHWYNNNIYNRHQAYNATSGKDMFFEVLSHNDGSGVVNTGGSVTNNKNLTTVTNATENSYVATMGWVNNPETSTNVVHRSGDETIAGNKTFSNRISFPSGYYMTTDANDNSLRIIRSGSGHGNNYKIIIQGDSGKIFAPNGFQGNLEGNADTSTKASYLDNYSVPGMNKIYLDWDKQVKGYVGLKVDNTTMGGLITTKNIGSQAANSATYATTQATSDNSTKIATTAWVRTYVDSVAGSNTVGSSVSAYWSNSSNVTATGTASTNSSTNSMYPACYSEYINKTPVVGTVYSGAQLYTVLNAYASAKGTIQSSGQYNTRITTVTAQATFSNPISPTGKYLCTTANTVKFRAYVTAGNSSTVGSASVVDNSSTKSIFIRIE